MSTHTAATVPAIADTARRVARTAVQVLTAFATFAGVYVAVVQVLGHDAAIDGTNAGAWLIASAAWVTSAASIIAKVMALPAVNELLAKIRLSGQSTIGTQLDTETRMLTLQATDASH